MIEPKTSHIRFDKVYGFISVYDGNRYLYFFEVGKYRAAFDRIRYFLGLKSGIIYVIFHNYEEGKVDSYNFLKRRYNTVLSTH